MLQSLIEQVYLANLELPARGLVLYTWGNVSGIDRARGLVVIKPSGVPYPDMRPEDMVVVDLSGKTVQGSRAPSSDLRTHLALYNRYPTLGGVAHTHSTYATVFAQAGRPIPAYGTTHADDFYGDIPVTRDMTPEEIRADYEAETGNVIIETLGASDPLNVPAMLVKNHGPFTWAKTPMKAAETAAILEQVAHMAAFTALLNPGAPGISRTLLDKHFMRKHGENAYYGQRGAGA